MREDAAVARLLRFGDPARGPGWNPRSPADPRLNVPRTRALLDLAGRPDARLVCVLVAGTKGKGSTAAFLASMLAAARIRAGLFTSPHLQSWRERIRVDGTAIAPGVFERAVDGAIGLVPRLRRRSPELGEPSAFELLVVAALTHFAGRRCRVAVLEVGLGGRYDATNAVEPAVSVVTPVGLDHREILGPTLAAIAREKAGVLRRGKPAILAPQRAAAARALARACREIGARCETVAPVAPGARLGLFGDHQRVNAGLAVAAARELAAIGLRIDQRSTATGLRRVSWPGRFEVVGRARPILLDGAHTPESAAALADALAARFGGRRVRLVFGCTGDRDPRAIARPLLPLVSATYATAAAGPRALPPQRVASALGPHVASRFATVAEALVAARDASRPGDVVCVTGSLALVGEARGALGLPVPERLW